MDLARRGLTSVFFAERGDFLFDLGAPLRRHRPIFRRDADDLESLDGTSFVACRLDCVAGGQHVAGEFVLIDFPRVADGGEHVALGEREPLSRLGIERRVGRDEVRVQLRIERAGGVMLETRRAEISGPCGLLRPRGVAAAHPPGGEALQLSEGDADRGVVRVPQSLVAKRDREQRDAFRRRALKVEKGNSAGTDACRELPAGERMTIAAQPLEGLIIGADLTASEPQPVRRLAYPNASDGFLLRIVIIRGEMIPEISRAIAQFRHREHGESLAGP